MTRANERGEFAAGDFKARNIKAVMFADNAMRLKCCNDRPT